MKKKRTENNFESVSTMTAQRRKFSIASIVLLFISGMCAIFISEAVAWLVCAFWICYLVITIIMIYRNTADVKDNLYEALDELDERYVKFETQNKELKAQNRELKSQNEQLLKKLERIEEALNIPDESKDENSESESDGNSKNE